MSTVLTYDPKEFSLIIGGNIISGFADDDYVEVERDEDAFSKKTGVDGITTRARIYVRTGKITFRVMQSSSSNDDLTSLALLNEQTPPGPPFAVLARDVSGRSVFSSDSAWIKKFPKATYKKDVNMNEWVVETGSLDIFLGGN